MFNKEDYWKRRNATPEVKKGLKRLAKQSLVVAFHTSPDWQKKVPGKKSLAAQTRNAQRAAIADLDGQLFIINHRTRSHAVPTHCFYCTDEIAKDGFCTNHYKMVFGGLTNQERMIEKAALRQMRADERKAKREAAEGVPA